MCDQYVSRVVDGLYIGSFGKAKDLGVLRELHIGFVVNCAKELDDVHRNEKDITYYRLDWDDTREQLILPHLKRATGFIRLHALSHTNCLVHCYMGRSRSASVILAYLIRFHHLSVDEAYKLLKTKAPVQINSNFLSQLRMFSGLCARDN